MKKRILSLLMAIVMVCSLLPVMSMPAYAANTTGEIGNNITPEKDTVAAAKPLGCADGHTEVKLDAVEPTCETMGKTEGIACSVCGIVIKRQETIAAKGHVVKNIAAVDPTCTEAGKTEGKICVVCEEVLAKQQPIPATGHSIMVDKAIVATCTEAGRTEGKFCGVCKEVLVKSEVIPAKGHTIEVTKNQYVDPACNRLGIYEEVHYCTTCNYVADREIKEIPALPHTDEDQNYKCDVCEAKLCTNHKVVVIKGYEPTCVKEGLTDGAKCEICGETVTEQEVIPAKGHAKTIVVGYQAGCTNEGLTDGVVCSVCDEVLIEQSVIPARGHMEAVKKAVAPTCTEDGLTESKFCSVCNATLVQPYTVPARGHVEVVDAAVESTCTAAGKTEGKHCVVCHQITVEQEPAPLKEHDFVEGKCTACAAADPNYVPPSPPPPPTVNPFEDVAKTDWYYEPILWAVEEGITGGTSATTFSPNAACTRAQVVTFLWAANGKPQPTLTINPFVDVAPSDWYYKAVLWAVEEGITGGTGANTFSPEQICTRVQVVTFLYAAAGKPEVSGSHSFKDVASDAWYANPVLWAVQNGVSNGVGIGEFAPDQNCTRAQIAMFLYRAMGGK